MVWVKICRRSLAAFSSISDGRPTDATLAKKASKETSPPSQAHAYLKIYECEDCCCRENCNKSDYDDNHKKLKKYMTEVVSTGVQTSLIYKSDEDDQVLHTFESTKSIEEVEDQMTTMAINMGKYNMKKNNCICYVRDLCKFLDPSSEDKQIPEVLKKLQEFLDEVSTEQGWRKLWIQWAKHIVLPVSVSAISLTYIYIQYY